MYSNTWKSTPKWAALIHYNFCLHYLDAREQENPNSNIREKIGKKVVTTIRGAQFRVVAQSS
jgi:hypothetical protein